MTSIFAVSEAHFQFQVVEYLNAVLPVGCVFHHSPNEGRRHVAYKVKLKKSGTQAGWPALEIFVPSEFSTSGSPRSIFLELKTKKGRISEMQKIRRDELLAAGCEWNLCRSLDDVEQFLDELIHLKVTK